ncbi:PLP-dependent aminotransferase family protein [Phenylobacterium sp. LjRoot225]|uniref:aminotransferase-like domain-containing protein n=1 Tax=Phenylobacterium sp. LjRoot225 TaxID=3342285 RepID=UPI003ECEBEFF
MTNHASRWAIAIRGSGKPAYIALADAIGEDIQSGKLAANEHLPPLRTLAVALDLNFTTVARGYGEAKQRGLIDAKAGRGTVVREFVPTPVHRPSPISHLDMTMNFPPEPQDRGLLRQIREGIASLADEPDLYTYLRYQEFGGSYEDREAGAAWLSRHLPGVTASRVLVCPGIQSAILGLFASLARPGDTIACEAITYPGVKGIAAQLGLRLVGLPLDDEGIDPEAFRDLCRADPPKALYLNPTLQNPTTATMSQARREAVAEIARTYSVPIIEDDAYGCLPAKRHTCLAAIAPELTFYIGGFAKILGAGLRIGYIVTPNVRYTARISAALRSLVIMGAPLTIRLATRFIGDGTVRAATLALREEARARQKLAAQVITRSTFVSKPEAFHLWLSVPEPWNRVEFANHLRANGVGVIVSDTFTVTGKPPEAVRVGLGGPSNRDQCRHMLEIIDDALEHVPAAAYGR